jgi:hypothetical protein
VLIEIEDLVGGFSPTPLKNMSQLKLLFPIYGKVKNVPNHQPVFIVPVEVKQIHPSSIRSSSVLSMTHIEKTSVF